MTTDIHAATQAIREALAAGPTPGPWLEKGRVHTSGEAIRIESHHPAYEHHLYQVCDVLDANSYPRNQANLQFIAACNPEAITAILAALEARDAALEARDAEIAALRANLRRAEATLFEARKLLDERPAVNAGLFEAYSRWTGKVYSLDWINAVDAAIDAARKDGV